MEVIPCQNVMLNEQSTLGFAGRHWATCVYFRLIISMEDGKDSAVKIYLL